MRALSPFVRSNFPNFTGVSWWNMALGQKMVNLKKTQIAKSRLVLLTIQENGSSQF